MVKIYLLRHGETAWNRDHNRYCGRTDIELSEVGREQAQKAREVLKSITFDAVYASTLKRAIETAHVVTGVEVPFIQTDSRLVEVDFGEWEGKQKETFIKEDPDVWNTWYQQPEKSRAGKTGETASEAFERARSFYAALTEKHQPDETILVTAHNTLNRIFIAGMLEMPLKNYRSINQFNTAITVFTLEKDQPISFLEINNYDHIK